MANPDLQVRGGHPDPKIRGSPGLQNLFFGPSGLILAKNKGRPPGPSPESATAHYVKEFVRLTMILEFFSLIYLSVWVNPLLMAVLTLIGKPFIVGLPYLRLKSAITGPHTLMHLFFYYFFFLDGWAWLISRLLINDRDYVFTEQTEAQPTHKLMLTSSPEGQGGEGTCALSTRLTLYHGIR